MRPFLVLVALAACGDAPVSAGDAATNDAVANDTSVDDAAVNDSAAADADASAPSSVPNDPITYTKGQPFTVDSGTNDVVRDLYDARTCCRAGRARSCVR